MVERSPLVADFLKCCNQYPCNRWVIGLSGGLDSIVLLQLASLYLPHSKLHVVHVNHHLQTLADDWAQFCFDQATVRGISFTQCDVVPKSSSELDARDARYTAFESFLNEGDTLLLAHHANDQVETLLFRLMRGSGLKGMCGMPVRRLLRSGQLLRPLLNIPRDELEHWAEEQSLVWVDDPTNQVDTYDRNFLRQHIVPLLEKRWPQAASQLAKTSIRLSADHALLTEYLEADLSHSLVSPRQLALSSLRMFKPEKRRALLRHWFSKVTGISLPDSFSELLDELGLVSNSNPVLQFKHWELRRHKDNLYISQCSSDVEPYSIPLREGRIELSHGELMVVKSDKGMRLASLEGVMINNRMEGMRCKPVKRPTKTIKHLFQEADIPAWQRNSWPVLMAQDVVVAIPNICIAEGWEAADDVCQGYALIWVPF